MGWIGRRAVRTSLRSAICRIFIILIPQQGVRLDLVDFVLEIAFIADNMFVIIALPAAGYVEFTSDTACDRRLICANNSRD